MAEKLLSKLFNTAKDTGIRVEPDESAQARHLERMASIDRKFIDACQEFAHGDVSKGMVMLHEAIYERVTSPGVQQQREIVVFSRKVVSLPPLRR